MKPNANDNRPDGQLEREVAVLCRHMQKLHQLQEGAGLYTQSQTEKMKRAGHKPLILNRIVNTKDRA